MKLYLSGAIQSLNVVDAKTLFRKTKIELESLGFKVINPFHVLPDCQSKCNLSKFQILDSGHTWQCYLKYDIREMLSCDGIYLLPNWQQSHGARLEFHIAASVGMEIFYG